MSRRLGSLPSPGSWVRRHGSLPGPIARRVAIAWTSYRLWELEKYVEKCKRERLRTPEAIAADERECGVLRCRLIELMGGVR